MRILPLLAAGLVATGLASLLAEEVPTPVEEQRRGTRPKYEQPTPVDQAEYSPVTLPLQPAKGERIVLIGNSLAERMNHYGHFETLLHGHFADRGITVRNLGFPAHTPAFRPDAGQPDPWAFPGARRFRPGIRKHEGKGHYPRPDEWLTLLDADTIIAFFGFNESFDGDGGVANFKAELTAFVDHTRGSAYNGRTAPRLVLVTPIAAEQHPDYQLPDAGERNRLLELYAKAIEEVARERQVGHVDLFRPTLAAIDAATAPITINGVHLGDDGYRLIAPILFRGLFGATPRESNDDQLLRAAVNDKNWIWRNDYRMPNGVHSYGHRWKPFGNFNYPEEIEKLREMTALRDRNIRAIAAGRSRTLEVDDASTRPLSPVPTNYGPSGKNGSPDYLLEKEALEKFDLPEGYEVSVFATEQKFPRLQNPAQMQFDNHGRLWVSVVPSYPHYQPGGPRPDDKLLVYEDTDGDGRADKETIFADQLHIPIGFQLAPEGVYISEEPYLTLHRDTDGDGRADTREYILDGFDTHDTHHAISAFDTDHGGGIFMCEGRFLHSQVETPHGPQRMVDGGVWRFDPRSWRVERVFQSDVSNPWGVAHDAYGQNFLNDASGGDQHWMLPLSIQVPHAYEIPKVELFNNEHKVRPTSGSEFIHSRHFPDEVQGDYLYCNTIGFLGIKQFEVLEDGTAIKAKHREDLIQSSDGNFRPADLEFAPDGSLYFIDWHNALIGHMQHSARDPMRNRDYGRIYRITCPSRPFVDPPQVAGASISRLFENLKLPELQARKRSHRELRGREAAAVIRHAIGFAAENSGEERLVLEALWATWGQQRPAPDLIEQLLGADDHRVRCAAVRVVRHSLHLLDHPAAFLRRAARDPHGRVRLEALSAASWLGGEEGAAVLLMVACEPTDPWIRNALNCAMLLLRTPAERVLANGGIKREAVPDLDQLLASKLAGPPKTKSHLTHGVKLGEAGNQKLRDAYRLGRQVYSREGSCTTCHQKDGRGLAGIYPPLAGTDWVNGDPRRLAKIILHGLWGPIEVDGAVYDPSKGVPPMTAFGGMLSDEEIAAVATYVRHSWGNRSGRVTAREVAAARAATRDQQGFLDPATLLEEHPLEPAEARKGP